MHRKVGPFSPFPGHLRRSGPGEEGFALLWEFLRAVPLTHLDLLDPVGSDRNHRPLDAASDAAPGSATHGHVS